MKRGFSALALIYGLCCFAQAGAIELPAQPGARQMPAPTLTKPAQEAAPYTMPKFQLEEGFPPDSAELLYSVLDALGRIHGGNATPLHKKLFGSLDGQNYLDYMGRSVNSFRFARDLDPTGIAYVAIAPDMIHLQTKFFSTERPLIFRMAALIHEARHTSAGGSPVYAHQPCPDPLLDDNGKEVLFSDGSRASGVSGACDAQTLGAYGTQVIFEGNIAKYCDNCTGKMKLDAQMEAERFYTRIYGKGRQALRKDIMPIAGR